MMAVISGDAVIQAVIWLIVAGLVYWVLDWALKKIGLPEPFNKIATVLLVILVVVVVINALFLISGHPLIKW